MLFTILEIIFAIALILAVLLQQKSGGLGEVFGGGGAVYTTKRGADLVLHKATIVISLLFFGVALLQIIFS